MAAEGAAVTITIHAPGEHQYKTPLLPVGPVTELRWYKTRTGAGLLVVFRRSIDGPIESVTFTAKIAGRLRALRVLAPPRQPPPRASNLRRGSAFPP